jgi:hypothetical protein
VECGGMVTGKGHAQHVLIALRNLSFHSACYEFLSEVVRSLIRITTNS